MTGGPEHSVADSGSRGVRREATDIRESMRRRNLQVRDGWDRFAPHRERVTSLLLRAMTARPDGARLCLLGAGNCNDVRLPELVRHAGEVHLVDLDAEALREGAARQGSLPLVLHGAVDVSGLVAVLECPEVRDGGAESAKRLCEAAAHFSGVRLPGPFDVTASLCLLTQLFDPIVNLLGPNHPRLWDVLEAVRRRHLQLLLELTKPGGTAVLVTDFVSSDTCPELAHVAPDALVPLVARQLAARNFFTGVHPGALVAAWQSDSRAAQVSVVGPWLWNLGPRHYAVCGVLAVRAPLGHDAST